MNGGSPDVPTQVPRRPPAPSNRRTPLTKLLRSIERTEELEIGRIVDEAATDGLALGLFAVAFPALVPLLPPGASTVVGVLVVVVGFQLMLGARRLWLPASIRRVRLSRETRQRVYRQGSKWARRLDRISRPRWPSLTSSLVSRLAGLPAVCMGLILILPMPFLNAPPAIAVMVLAVGLMNRDGALVIVGSMMSVALLSLLIGFPTLLANAWR